MEASRVAPREMTAGDRWKQDQLWSEDYNAKQITVQNKAQRENEALGRRKPLKIVHKD